MWHSAIYPFCAALSLVKNAADAKLVKDHVKFRFLNFTFANAPGFF